MRLKFTGELSAMTGKDDAKFEKELSYQFKTDMKNLISFHPNTQKSPKIAYFNGLLMTQVYNTRA